MAIKFEPRKSEAPQLRDEYKSYKILAGTGIDGVLIVLEGIPRVFYYGQEGTYNCLVMELLGHSLEYLFDCCSRHFTIQSVALLAIQMVRPFSYFRSHECNLFMSITSFTGTSSQTTFLSGGRINRTSFTLSILGWQSIIETQRPESTFHIENEKAFLERPDICPSTHILAGSRAEEMIWRH